MTRTILRNILTVMAILSALALLFTILIARQTENISLPQGIVGYFPSSNVSSINKWQFQLYRSEFGENEILLVTKKGNDPSRIINLHTNVSTFKIDGICIDISLEYPASSDEIYAYPEATNGSCQKS